MEHKQRQWVLRQQKNLQLQNFSRFLERTLRTPRQYNAIDCGVFVCMFVIFIAFSGENGETYNSKLGEFTLKPIIGTIFRYRMARILFMDSEKSV